MRIALVAHGFPPLERTGVENHVADLAREFARSGHEVHVFVPRRDPRRPELALRAQERDRYTIHWLTRNEPPRSAADHLEVEGVERAFGDWLDRERPDVVHVHHVAKLGLGILAAAKKLGVPVIFTAHDYFAICHRITMLRPDLERCDKLGDAAACTRCDLAVTQLNRVKGLGDYHAGVFPEDLERGAREQLARALGDPLSSRRGATALEERRALDARRLAALRACELVLTPSRFVGERLIGAGLARERVAVELLGVDVAALAAVERPFAQRNQPLRLGFVGGTSKHKGLHVLLAALEGLGPRVRLSIWGDSSDRRWTEQLMERAKSVGATWNGAFDAADRARVFGSFDVLCVPSIWDENAPLVIHEAFAAGRPVLASRVGALDESVRDGVDGLLLPPGDANAWRAVLEGWIRERAPLEKLVAGVSAPRALADEAAATLARYASLIAERRELTPPPASLAAFHAEHTELECEPFDALVERVARGLERFRVRVGVEGASCFAVTIRSGAAREILDRARDARSERAWLARSLALRKDAREEVARLARSQRELAKRFEAEHARLLAEREALIGAKTAAEEELVRRQTHSETVATELARIQTALSVCQAAHARAEEFAQSNAEDRRKLGEHAAWLERLLRDLARETGAAESGEVEREVAAAREALASAHTALAELRRELDWRRGEMRAALGDRGGLFGKGELGTRLETWRAADGSAPR
ncbi:MAG: glycosyltransferase [Planctomycetes bacterium]|nr:glycosyltransferase [Planctomycetota bacterium]